MTRYNLTVHQNFVRAVSGGATDTAAAGYCGIGLRTAKRWLSTGRRALERWDEGELDEDARSADPDWQWAQLARDVDEARSRVHVGAAAVLIDGALGRPAEYDERGNLVRAEVPPDPRLALEILARTDPEHWGRTMRPGETWLREKGHHDEGDLAELLDAGEELIEELAARGD